MQSHSELSVGEVFRQTSRRLKLSGIDSPQLDARILIAHAVGCETEELIRYDEQLFGTELQSQLQDLVARRLDGEPIAYLVGEKEFWSRPFFVERDVLIPRPDTETIVETVLTSVPDQKKRLSILDLGVGTGCILITLLKELPHATGVGVDISEMALNVSRKNAMRHDVSERISWILSDWLGNVNDSFDIIVANPPYISLSDLKGLDRTIREFEPQMALAGGNDGLSAYRKICRNVADHLNPRGTIYLEIGHQQASDVTELLSASNFSVVNIVKDLGQRDRCIVSMRRDKE